MRAKSWPAAMFALFVATILVDIPASLVAEIAIPRTADLMVYDLHGSVWRGGARQVRWKDHSLGEAMWTLQPKGFLHGALEYRLQMEGNARAEARIIRTIRRIEIRDLEASIPVSWLPFPPMTSAWITDRDMMFSIPSAVAVDNRLLALSGSASWLRPVGSDGVDSASGKMHAKFALAGRNCVHWVIEDTKGTSLLAGNFDVDAVIRQRPSPGNQKRC